MGLGSYIRGEMFLYKRSSFRENPEITHCVPYFWEPDVSMSTFCPALYLLVFTSSNKPLYVKS